MSKFSPEERLRVVQYVLDEAHSMYDAADKFAVSHSEVQRWVAVYKCHGTKGLMRQRISYTGDFKQMVVEDMRTTNLSYRDTAAKYHLGNHHIPAKWERIYLEEGAQGLYVERRGRRGVGSPKELPKSVEEDLLAEVQRLRAEVDYLKKLNALAQRREQRERKPR